jgi:hypothetical protein
MTGLPPSVNRAAAYARTRSDVRIRTTCANYARYEAEKTIWVSGHSGATPCEYEWAIRAIARACGL